MLELLSWAALIWLAPMWSKRVQAVVGADGGLYYLDAGNRGRFRDGRHYPHDRRPPEPGLLRNVRLELAATERVGAV